MGVKSGNEGGGFKEGKCGEEGNWVEEGNGGEEGDGGEEGKWGEEGGARRLSRLMRRRKTPPRLYVGKDATQREEPVTLIQSCRNGSFSPKKNLQRNVSSLFRVLSLSAFFLVYPA